VRSRTLVAILLAPLPAVALLAGCRAVIGLEELHVADASTEASGDAAPHEAGDAATTDASGPSDANLTDDVKIIAEGCKTSDCRRCCKEAFQQANARFEQAARTAGCICAGADTCAAECNASTCAAPPTAPTGACAPCLDQHLIGATPACNAARAACKADPQCGPAATCLEACPPG
jgi:hypothetical protein